MERWSMAMCVCVFRRCINVRADCRWMDETPFYCTAKCIAHNQKYSYHWTLCFVHFVVRRPFFVVVFDVLFIVKCEWFCEFNVDSYVMKWCSPFVVFCQRTGKSHLLALYKSYWQLNTTDELHYVVNFRRIREVTIDATFGHSNSIYHMA